MFLQSSMPHPHPIPGKRTGFSLVELLTVLAVIALLAAILLPVLGQVRQKMASSQSASNLRQLGGALQVFANEYKGHFPPVAIQTKSEEGTWQNLGSWDSYLLKYLGVDAPSHGATRNYDKIKPVAEIFSHPRDNSEITTEGGIRRSYGCLPVPI